MLRMWAGLPMGAVREHSEPQLVCRTWDIENLRSWGYLGPLEAQKSLVEISSHLPAHLPDLSLASCFLWLVEKNISVTCRADFRLGFVHSQCNCWEFPGVDDGTQGVKCKTHYRRTAARLHILKSDKWKMGMVSNLITFVFRCCWEQTLIYELATDTRFPAWIIYIWMSGRMDR